jgi:hypothetical protein
MTGQLGRAECLLSPSRDVGARTPGGWERRVVSDGGASCEAAWGYFRGVRRVSAVSGAVDSMVVMSTLVMATAGAV